jgi:hypothetical protein
LPMKQLNQELYLKMESRSHTMNGMRLNKVMDQFYKANVVRIDILV